jgi:hypothetical protein
MKLRRLSMPAEMRTRLKRQERERLKFALDEDVSGASIKSKHKKSIKEVIGLPQSEINIDFKRARAKAREERVSEIISRLHEESE